MLKVKYHNLESYQKNIIQKLTICAIYCPPNHYSSEFEFTNLLHALGDSVIADCDFNAKYTFWGLRLKTQGVKNY